ncbi:hypothetical protein ACR3K2_37760 [Cryptosporidium serpentis]
MESNIRTCNELQKRYFRCLRKSNLELRKCENLELQLEACSKNTQRNYCINELKSLVKCIRKPNKDGCSREFIEMRECNRPKGPRIKYENGIYFIKIENNKYIKIPEYAIFGNRSSMKESINKLKEEFKSNNTDEEFKKNLTNEAYILTYPMKIAGNMIPSMIMI